MSNLNPNQNQNPLGDKRLILGIVLIFGFMWAWQTYLAKKYPQPVKAPVSTATPGTGVAGDERAAGAKTVDGKPASADPALTGPALKGGDAKSAVATPQPEKLFEYEDEKIRFVLSSHGMGLKEFTLKTYRDLAGQPIQLGTSTIGNLFETRLGATNFAVDFDVQQPEKGLFQGIARTDAGTIKRTLKYDAEKGSFENTIDVSDSKSPLSQGLITVIPDTIQANVSTSWLFPSYAHQDFVVGHSGTTETVNYSRTKENLIHDYSNVSFISSGDQYFATAILDHSEIAPTARATADVNGKTAAIEMTYKPVQTGGNVGFKQIFYAGPKSIDVLQRIDPAMASIIDFGMLSFIAKPLLWVMKAFHSAIGNWGWAIIFLTLMVRLCVLPFNLMSFRSMKAMQKIQPLMASVREKYKDDPMTQQREIMALMKTHKANPLGGCLPMLLQIPIFFALYRVIGSSVELYRSPFIGWIHDLSQHDPFYILPVLMGVTMFLQSKLTPTTADPAQQKVMQWLPVIFTVFMLNLPSGLTLYMVVSAVFGIVQQWMVLRDKRAPVPVKA